MTRSLLFAGPGLALPVLLSMGSSWFFPSASTALRLGGVVEVQEVGLGPRIAGRVARVDVKEGDMVAPGQVLVVLEARELESQSRQCEARVAAVEADLAKVRNGPRPSEKEAARAEAASARARWQRAKAGSREEEVREARADTDAAKADFLAAEADFARASRLLQKGVMPPAEFEAVQAKLGSTRGRYGSERANLDRLVNGSRPEEVAEAFANLEQAEAKYRLLLDGTRREEFAALEARLAEEQGKLDEIRSRLAEREVRAPERGTVEVVTVRKGDLVSSEQPLVQVLRAEDIWVKAFVPETDLGKVRLRQRVRVTIDSYPGRVFEGTVQQIASASEFTPRNVQTPEQRRHQVFGLKVLVPDPQGIFKAGMAAEVELPTGEAS